MGLKFQSGFGSDRDLTFSSVTLFVLIKSKNDRTLVKTFECRSPYKA